VGKPVGAGLTDAQGMILACGLDLDVNNLLQACRLDVWEFDHLIAHQFSDHHISRHPSPIIDLRDGYEAYADTVKRESGKTYRTTQYKSRKIARDHGELRHHYGTRDLDGLRTLIRWKSEQYRRTGRTDRFAHPWIIQLVEDLLHTNTPSFDGVLDMLWVDDRPVAGHFGLRSDTVLAGWFPAYDPAFAVYSPGLIQHLAMAEQASKHGIQVIDMGRGEKEYKEKLKNGQWWVAEGRLARPTVAAGVHWLLRTPVSSARRTVLANPSLRMPADRLLKTYGKLRTTLRSSAPDRTSSSR